MAGWSGSGLVYLAFNAREIELDDARFDCPAANAESLEVSRHLCQPDRAQRARVAEIKALPAAALTDLKLKAELARALYEFWDDLRCDDYPCGEAGRMVVEDVLAL